MIEALVDHRKRFLDVEIGWPGSVPDNRLFQLSSLSKNYEAVLAPLRTTPLMTGNGVVEDIPAFILGDSAYRNTRHLVTTYTNTECKNDRSIRHLNEQLSRARYIVENSFALLRARFQLLEKPLRSGAEDLPFAIHLIASLFVLHNFLIEEQDYQKEVLAPHIQRELEAMRLEEEEEEENDDDVNGEEQIQEPTRTLLLRHIRWLDANE